ncbi:MAG: hypothetical protein IJT72_08435 [Lachnospiraceae bacterium]|nr:hypothetical protein [Lachnospiraceae bacterium]
MDDSMCQVNLNARHTEQNIQQGQQQQEQQQEQLNIFDKRMLESEEIINAQKKEISPIVTR